jgi:hypothetical protein
MIPDSLQYNICIDMHLFLFRFAIKVCICNKWQFKPIICEITENESRRSVTRWRTPFNSCWLILMAYNYIYSISTQFRDIFWSICSNQELWRQRNSSCYVIPACNNRGVTKRDAYKRCYGAIGQAHKIIKGAVGGILCGSATRLYNEDLKPLGLEPRVEMRSNTSTVVALRAVGGDEKGT